METKSGFGGISAHFRRESMLMLGLFVAPVVLGVVAAILIPRITSSPDVARLYKAKQDVRLLGVVLETRHERVASYPASLDSLVLESYLNKLPLDPWGHPYQYKVIQGRPIILSLGRDGVPGGSGMDYDMSSVTPDENEKVISSIEHQGRFQIGWFALCILAVLGGVIGLAMVGVKTLLRGR